MNIINNNFSVPLRSQDALKAKDTLCEKLYDCIFRQILAQINGAISFQSSSSAIGIIDIAGFGSVFTITFGFPLTYLISDRVSNTQHLRATLHKLCK